MVKEAYVSFEVAKLLNEKGFNWSTQYVYTLDGTGSTPHKIGNWRAKSNIQMPTHQMAMKWLREIYNKHCDIGYDVDLKWFFQIIDLKETVEYDYPETKYYHAENEIGFNTYEEAVEAALKYSLENLI